MLLKRKYPLTPGWHILSHKHWAEVSVGILLSRFVRDESGVTAIEYGLIAALIAVVIIGAVATVGTKLSTTFSTVAGSL